jgi:Mg2+-importing ATPase
VSAPASLSLGVALPFTPLAPWLGFVPLPPLFLAFLLGMTALYLAAMELAKRPPYRAAGI